MRMTLVSRRVATAVVGGALALGLAACSSDDDSGDVDDATTEENATDADDEDVEDADDEAEEDAEDDDHDHEVEEAADPSGDGAWAEWAFTATPGDQIATIEADTFQVDVYQVGVAPSPKDGSGLDPDSGEPVLAEGDDIVFMNYVVTNTSDEPVKLGSTLVKIDPRYADWPYVNSMDTITDYDLYEEMGLESKSIDFSNFDLPDPQVYTLGPGQSYTQGHNIMYRTDVPLVIEASLTPVDDNGESLRDDTVEASVEVTLD